MTRWCLCGCVTSLLLGCGDAVVGEDCTPAHHCSLVDGVPTCEDGYTWEAPSDQDNLRCVLAGPCTPEADATFCLRLGKNCDALTADDNCGVPRTVSCGTCAGLASCGGLGVANVCGTSTCSNGTLETHEACEGLDLRLTTCALLGFDGGPLACTSACTFDTSECHACDNGLLEPAEECDGTLLQGETCEIQGFALGGTLACTTECTLDTAGCRDCLGGGDCTAEQYCHFPSQPNPWVQGTPGTCSSACTDDISCGAVGQSCIRGQCYTNVDCNPALSSADCPPGEVCNQQSRVCSAPPTVCYFNEQCPYGWQCSTENVCFDPT